MGQLRQLDQRCSKMKRVLPERATTITTPLQVQEWAAALSEHPDKEWVQYLLEGVQDWLLRREGDPAVEREKHEVHGRASTGGTGLP